MRRSIISSELVPISCHFPDCKALLFESIHVSMRYSKYPDLYVYLLTDKKIHLMFRSVRGIAAAIGRWTS